MDEVHVKEYLKETDEAFRGLIEQHQAFERELEGFVDKPYLTPDEQLRETEIKKKKLVLKDQMQMIISQFLAQKSTA